MENDDWRSGPTAYSVERLPSLTPPPPTNELASTWCVAVDMWRAHAPSISDPADPPGVCKVCRVSAPCAMWSWLSRFLSAAAGEQAEGQGGPLPCLPESPECGGLRYRGRAVTPAAPVEMRRLGPNLPASALGRDDRGWFG
jgi:hypothetical protein